MTFILLFGGYTSFIVGYGLLLIMILLDIAQRYSIVIQLK
jgi:hypothetical protein